MQIGRKFPRYMMERLKPIDWAWVREQFVINDTRCEYPGCHEPAYDAVTSERLFAFVCVIHKQLHRLYPDQVHRILCVKMIEAMRVRVYKYQEVLSGGSVAVKLADDLDAARGVKRRKAQAARDEVRQHRQSDNMKPGAPDDGLIARQRTRMNQTRKQIQQAEVSIMPTADFI